MLGRGQVWGLDTSKHTSTPSPLPLDFQLDLIDLALLMCFGGLDTAKDTSIYLSESLSFAPDCFMWLFLCSAHVSSDG